MFWAAFGCGEGFLGGICNEVTFSAVIGGDEAFRAVIGSDEAFSTLIGGDEEFSNVIGDGEGELALLALS